MSRNRPAPEQAKLNALLRQDVPGMTYDQAKAWVQKVRDVTPEMDGVIPLTGGTESGGAR